MVDGHNIEEVVAALDQAHATKDQPTMLVAKTFKGKGVSFLEDKPGWHGKPLKGDDLDKALGELELSKGTQVPAVTRPAD